MLHRSRRPALPLLAIEKRRFWRCLPRQHVRSVLEAGPSFTRERRYSVRGEFGALYFSASRELSLREVSSRVGQDVEGIACMEFEVTVDRLVDLTQPQTRTKLNIELADLIRPRISRDAYAVPQRIARQIYEEKMHGLLAPSVHDPTAQRKNWFNLVLYPANLVRFAVREVRTEEIAHRW